MSSSDALKKDVYILFRLLCRISMQTDIPTKESKQQEEDALSTAVATAPVEEVSPRTLKARILALEMILSILNNAKPTFFNNELTVKVTRQHLCLSVSKNAISTNPSAFELSLSIFLLIIRFFRDKLKPEIEILLNNVFLSVLEMGNSTHKQKNLILQGLLKLCESPQTLMDLFVNYDCDMNSVSVYERIVALASKIAQTSEHPGSQSSTLMTFAASAAGLDSKSDLIKAQTKRLRLRSLCVLVAVSNSLVDWYKSFDKDNRLLEPAVAEVQNLSIMPVKNPLTSVTMVASPTINDSSSSSAPASLNASCGVEESLTPEEIEGVHTIIKAEDTDNVTESTKSQGMTQGVNPSSTAEMPNDKAGININEIANKKQQLKEAIKLFNRKPQKGITLLVKSGFFSHKADQVAKFLFETASLNKKAIGEYIGEGEDFNKNVMYAFIDLMNFTSKNFVNALRQLLQTFRLPGEAQKIDRIMEKFADKYCENNPGIFSKADTAYTLAYSVIMLNTDQHSPQIKNRMQLSDFIKNNRGINDNTDLPDPFLTEIFNEIHTNEIIMEEERFGQLAQLAMGWGAGDIDDRQRMELYHREVATIQKKTQQLMTFNSQKPSSPFRSANQRALSRTVFSLSSWSFMATFSLLFEAKGDTITDSSSDPNIIDLCLQGFDSCIRLSSWMKMDTERDAFLSSLAKLCGLSKIHELKLKNIKAIRTLLTLATVLGEHLDSSWIQVITVISQMERLQEMALRSVDEMDGFTRDSPFESDGTSVTGGVTAGVNNGPSTTVSTGVAVGLDSAWTQALAQSTRKASQSTNHYLNQVELLKHNPTTEKILDEITNQDTLLLLDKIFSQSRNLSIQAMIHYISALCKVSLDEVGLFDVPHSAFSSITDLSPQSTIPDHSPIDTVSTQQQQPRKRSLFGGVPVPVSGSGPPRMYLMQRIVETVYYNMDRIRFEWSQIWKLVQPHFNIVSCHPSTTVATFAIDSLRQLCMKFLGRDELSHFSTQSEFLKGFEWIMKNSKSLIIKELILSSISQMINSRACNIKSGWKSIFVVLSLSIVDPINENLLVKTSFEMIKMIFKDHFDILVVSGCFMDCTLCLSHFVLLNTTETNQQEHENIVLTSLELLHQCATSLTGQLFDTMSIEYPQDTHTATHNVTDTDTLTKSNVHVVLSPDVFQLKWLPILSAFARVASQSNSDETRSTSMEFLFETLQEAHSSFDYSIWNSIFSSVIFPMFGSDDERTCSSRCIHSLQLLTEMLGEMFDIFTVLHNGHLLLEMVFDLMISITNQQDQDIATSGQICFYKILLENSQFIADSNPNVVRIVTQSIEKMYMSTIPSELLNCDYSSSKSTNSHQDSSALAEAVISIGVNVSKRLHTETQALESMKFEEIIRKCANHLEWVENTRKLLFSVFSVGETSSTMFINALPFEVTSKILQLFYESYALARAFNVNYDLRFAIWKKGLISQMPNLIKQETSCLSSYLFLSFAVYNHFGDAVLQQDFGKSFLSLDNESGHLLDLSREITGLTDRFCGFLADESKFIKEITIWLPVIQLLVQELTKFKCIWLDDPKYSTLALNVDSLYNKFVQMIIVDQKEFRSSLIPLLLQYEVIKT